MPYTHTNHAFRLLLRLSLAAVLLPMLAALGTWEPAAAVDHREGPLITLDAGANITDTYSVTFPGAANVAPAGPLALFGDPFAPGAWGDADTLFELSGDIPNPLTAPVTIPIQLTQLSLRSTQPLTVTYPDGTTEQWDIELGLSQTTPSTGTLDLFPSGPGGGNVGIELLIYLSGRYIRQGDSEVRTFDYGTQPGGAIQLGGSGSFSLSCPPNRLAIPGVTTPFCLGHNLSAGAVLPVTLIDIDNPSNPRFVSRVEPAPAFGPPNAPPTLAPIGNMTVLAGNQLGRTLAASDSNGNALTFSATGLPAFCSLTDRGNGTALLICGPTAGDAGSYTITFGVTDNGTPPLSDSETVTLTVVQSNRPPVLDPIGPLEVPEGVTRTFNFSATDPDGDSLTFVIQNAPAYSSFVDNGDGTASFTVTPLAGSEFEFFEITVTVTDDGAPPLSDQETFTLNITPGSGNEAPVLDPIGDQTVRMGGPTTLLGLVRATDVNSDTLSVNAVGLPTPCSLVPNASGPGLVVQNLRCDGDVLAGVFTVTVTVTDGHGGSDSETFTLTVQPPLDTGGDQTVIQGAQVLLNPTSSPGSVVELDLDNDGVFESPAPATFDATGLVPGDYPVGVRALLNGVFNTGSITVTVVPPEDQVLVLEPVSVTLNAGTDAEFRAFVGPPDADGNPEVGDDGVPGTADDDFEPASVTWAADRGAVSPASGPSTTYTAPAEPGSDQVRATDADGRTASADVTVRRAWTYDNLRRLTFEYVDNPFAARGLALLVDLAAAADSRGFGQVADGILDAYIRGLRAITPRLLTPAERDELVEGAQALEQE